MIFAYARKSTESDERQIQSIEDQIIWIMGKVINLLSLNFSIIGIAEKLREIKNTDEQINWINELLKNKGFKLYGESKTAKDPDVRIEFYKMLADIKNSRQENIIIAWKLDRLSRNPVDSGNIQYMMQRGKLQKIITTDREYSPVDSGLLMSVENAMSNQFILDMVKNVARGMESKVKKGGCIQYAPPGYINNKITKEVEIDKNLMPFIKEIFFLRDVGNSYNEIAEKMNKKGLKGRKGGDISKSTIERIIKNPFYIGLQKFQGKLYKSIHENIINVEVWDRVNSVKRGYKRHNAEIEFPLKGIVKNYHTKKPLLALWKKQKYIYYSTHSREEYIINLNQNEIIERFDKYIGDYTIPEKYQPLILDQIQEALTTVYDNISEQKLALSSKQKDLDNKSKRLFDLVLNGTIDDEKYKSENNKISIEQIKLEDELIKLNNLDLILIDEARELVELLINLELKRKKSNSSQKAQIIKIILVELFVDTQKQLYIQEKELFESIKILNGYNWQGL